MKNYIKKLFKALGMIVASPLVFAITFLIGLVTFIGAIFNKFDQVKDWIRIKVE